MAAKMRFCGTRPSRLSRYELGPGVLCPHPMEGAGVLKPRLFTGRLTLFPDGPERDVLFHGSGLRHPFPLRT